MTNSEKIALLNQLAQALEVNPETVAQTAQMTKLKQEKADLRAFLSQLVDVDSLGVHCSDDVKDEARRLLGMPPQ